MADSRSDAHSGGTLIGASSLLTIFAVLCIVVFSILALSAQQADVRVFESMENSTIAYWTARDRVEQMIGEYRQGACGTGWHDFEYETGDGRMVRASVRFGANGELVEGPVWTVIRVADWNGDYHIPVYEEDEYEN